MAPELVRKSEYWGHKVDVWALGVLLYRMLTGIYPFRANKDRELYRKIGLGQFDQKCLPNGEVRDLISKMLKVNPSERISLDMAFNHKWLNKH